MSQFQQMHGKVLKKNTFVSQKHKILNFTFLEWLLNLWNIAQLQMDLLNVSQFLLECITISFWAFWILVCFFWFCKKCNKFSLVCFWTIWIFCLDFLDFICVNWNLVYVNNFYPVLNCTVTEYIQFTLHNFCYLN